MSDTPQIDAVLFDCDGTLIDTYEIILASMRYSINEVLGKSCTDAELMHGVGTPLIDQMVHFCDGNRALADCIIQIYRDHNDIVHDANVRAFPDTAAALERLQAAGIKMGVVTSKRHAMAARGLEMSGISPFLPVLIGHDDCETHKPQPGPILLGCEMLGTAPARTLYVGDSPYDIQAGNAAGCPTAAALWGMFSAEELAAQSPTYTAATLTELLDQLAIPA